MVLVSRGDAEMQRTAKQTINSDGQNEKCWIYLETISFIILIILYIPSKWFRFSLRLRLCAIMFL